VSDSCSWAIERSIYVMPILLVNLIAIKLGTNVGHFGLLLGT